MAIKISNHFMFNCIDSYLNGVTIKAFALASGGGFDPTAVDYDSIDDIGMDMMNEFDGANYARPTIANLTITESDANDNVVVDCDDVVLTDLGAGTYAIEGWMLYVDGVDDANRKLIGWYGYASEQTPNGNDFTLQIDAAGLFTLAQSA